MVYPFVRQLPYTLLSLYHRADNPVKIGGHGGLDTAAALAGGEVASAHKIAQASELGRAAVTVQVGQDLSLPALPITGHLLPEEGFNPQRPL